MSSTALTERLGSLYRLDDRAVERGRHVSTTFLIDAGAEQALVDIEHGRVAAITDPTAAVMPTWRFALRAPAQEWDAFWEALPRPGSHDLFALLRRRQLRLEGDLYPFMSNLFYFKELLAQPRTL